MIELPQGRPAPGSCPPQQKLTALVPPEISRKTRTCAGGFHSCGSRFHQIYPTVCKGKAVWSGSFLKFELATLGIVYIHPEDLCSWYKAFKDLFSSMLVVKPWQEPIPVPQREAQPLVAVSFVAAQPWTPKWRSLWPATSRGKGRPILRCLSAEPTGLESHFFGLQVTHLPSPPRQLSHGESPRQWLCVGWTDVRHAAYPSLWWSRLVTPSGEFPKASWQNWMFAKPKTLKKYELKHQAPFHYPSRFSLRRFQSLLHQA